MQYSQKNSPYIEEVSRHLDFLVEIGMFEKWKADVLGNATMCNTLRKKLDSKQETLTVLSLSHVGTTFALTFLDLWLLQYHSVLNLVGRSALVQGPSPETRLFRHLKLTRSIMLLRSQHQVECDQMGQWLLGQTAFNESYSITVEQPRHFGYGFGHTLASSTLVEEQ